MERWKMCRYSYQETMGHISSTLLLCYCDVGSLDSRTLQPLKVLQCSLSGSSGRAAISQLFIPSTYFRIIWPQIHILEGWFGLVEMAVNRMLLGKVNFQFLLFVTYAVEKRRACCVVIIWQLQ
ncbi:unnamed protein product [Ostreobium quekettii]|uniref:Uncharacterized protein n=1 Tax=Ostreobium quekettii TaxID=121088 RepID=A0A8S1J790_9CHLO|nr:unnamed protein product [Ostreobium quekettii]|eukprot:evm.model.scf_1399.1 EVM.evm.TU.scf_1399.1   scf_1399:4664-5032(+)